MRSELVFGAMQHVANRYLLVKLAAKAVRALHRPNTRVEETANDVLQRFAFQDPRPEPGSSGRDCSELRLAS